MTVLSRRAASVAVPLVAGVGVLVSATPASAATSTFHRIEIDATANYTVFEDCPDGSTAESRITVIGGHEEEQQDGTTTLDSDFLTVLIRSIDCDGAFTSDTISGPAAFQAPPSLKRARVLGTVTDDGRTVSVQMHWTATGDMERTRNVTRFPGFFGVFEGKSRDAVATGTVVLDGETIVDGTTTNAQIESLEDTNVSESSDT